jgi:hypothetical protein
VGFEDLADIHTAGHAERIEHDIDRRPSSSIRHVFIGTIFEITPLLP